MTASSYLESFCSGNLVVVISMEEVIVVVSETCDSRSLKLCFWMGRRVETVSVCVCMCGARLDIGHAGSYYA